jgi:AcrR family transcriptional regulator
MATNDGPQLRADAARNSERIADAAYVVFAGNGHRGSMEDVPAQAGVGIATVYRRFPRKLDLLRTILDRRWDEVMTPALLRDGEELDAGAAMRISLEGAVRFVVDDQVMLSAASDLGLMTMDLPQRFVEPVGKVLGRGRRAGVFRDDLVDEDIPGLALMLFAALPALDAGSDGWWRYLDLMLDALPARTTPLTPASPVHETTRTFGR